MARANYKTGEHALQQRPPGKPWP